MEGPEGNQKHVQNEAGQSGTKNSSIFLYGDKVIICDRKRNILIEVDVSNGDVKEFSRKGECKSADGCPSFCCFAQPFLVCCEEKTLLVIDRPTLNHYFIKATYQLSDDFAIYQQSLWNAL